MQASQFGLLYTRAYIVQASRFGHNEIVELLEAHERDLESEIFEAKIADEVATQARALRCCGCCAGLTRS